MLTYAYIGVRDYRKRSVEIYRHEFWECWVLLSGSISLLIGEEPIEVAGAVPMLWMLPAGQKFGCRGEGDAERAIFDFSAVPAECERMLPGCGYYQTRLSASDCRRIRAMAKTAQEILSKPSPLCDLQQNAMVSDLSLLALREIAVRPVVGSQKSRIKVSQACEIFAAHMSEGVHIAEVASMLHLSRAQLHRLFLQETGETPKVAFQRVRMQKVERLLLTSGYSVSAIAEIVGMSEASALTRAVRAHFGMSPRQLRAAQRT